jgi:hypothetical protein
LKFPNTTNAFSNNSRLNLLDDIQFLTDCVRFLSDRRISSSTENCKENSIILINFDQITKTSLHSISSCMFPSVSSISSSIFWKVLGLPITKNYIKYLLK